MELKFGNDPNVTQQILKLIDEAIEMQFPGLKAADPTQYDQIKTQVKKDLSDIIQHIPSLTTHPADLKIHITHSIHKQNLSLEKQIEKILTRDFPQIEKGTAEFENIKQGALEKMKDFTKEAPTLAHNPKAREYFLTVSIASEMSAENKATQAPGKSISRLSLECQKLITEIKEKEKNLPNELKLAPKLTKILNDANKQARNDGLTPEAKLESVKGVLTMANMLLVSTQINGPKQFTDLPEVDRANILSYGANPKDGLYQITPQTSTPMPSNIIVYLATPIAEVVAPQVEKNSFLNPFNTTPKPPGTIK